MSSGVRKLMRSRAGRKGFAPPAEAVDVKCLHCGEVYSSRLIVCVRGVWRCATSGCDGVGFRFDLIPVSELGGVEIVSIPGHRFATVHGGQRGRNG